jgi:hypothetical protein
MNAFRLALGREIPVLIMSRPERLSRHLLMTHYAGQRHILLQQQLSRDRWVVPVGNVRFRSAECKSVQWHMFLTCIR